MIEAYTGKKWRVDGEKQIPNPNIWAKDTYITVPNFRMTKSYATYLKAKRELEKAEKIRNMREKLAYQERTYGEVDPVDVSELIALMQSK